MSKQKKLKALEKIHKTLSDPGVWIKSKFALAPGGEDTSPSDPRACQFCLDGAAQHVLRHSKKLYTEIRVELAKSVVVNNTNIHPRDKEGYINTMDGSSCGPFIWELNDHSETKLDDILGVITDTACRIKGENDD